MTPSYPLITTIGDPVQGRYLCAWCYNENPEQVASYMVTLSHGTATKRKLNCVWPACVNCTTALKNTDETLVYCPRCRCHCSKCVCPTTALGEFDNQLVRYVGTESKEQKASADRKGRKPRFGR